MSREPVKTEGLHESEFAKLMDWGLETQLTWSVIFLTCFIGLIELLPTIPSFDSAYSLAKTSYLLFIGLIYGFLVGGFAYSIDRTAEIIRWNFEWAKRTPKSKLREWLYKTRGWLIKKLLCTHGKLLVRIAIGFLVFVWAAIFMLKVLFGP